MSMFERPVSEMYEPDGSNQLALPEPSEHYAQWGYSVAYENDADNQSVPRGGNTAIFLIAPGGMTEPELVTKQGCHATFEVSVLAGQGALVRMFASGAHETRPINEGDEFVIRPGEAYSYVNTGNGNLLLHDVARPAFQPGDDSEILQAVPIDAKVGMRLGEDAAVHNYKKADGTEQIGTLPKRFFDLIGAAAAGRLKV